MSDYKVVMSQITPNEEALSALKNIPFCRKKAKNYLLKKSLVLAVAIMILVAFSSVTAYAASELYGWKLIEHEIAERGGIVTSRYYEETENGKMLKAMEFEYDSIYWHITGKAVLKDDFVEVTEEGTIKEEYAYLFENDAEMADGQSFGITLTPEDSNP